jgi:ribosome-binding protein aMBF1 (putative translation factor)
MRMNERLNTIQKIENGSRPTDDLVSKLEKILGISLLGESNIEYDAQLSRGSGRGLTIADALEDYLSKGDSDD